MSYVANRIQGLKPSPIRKYFDIAANMPEAISLGIGEPDFTTPLPIIEAGKKSLDMGETHYTSNSGLTELRQAIATHLHRLYNVQYDPAKEVIVTVGGSEALILSLMATLNPGDEVLIPTPCFVSYQGDVVLAGGVPIDIPTYVQNGFVVDPADLRAAITPKTKVIFIGYPCNPTGAVASREVMLEIAKIAEEHDLVVISDEIYDRLVYTQDHVCFSSLPGMKERTILLNGFSKSYAMTGWRVGFACATGDLITSMLRIHQYLIMSAPTISQKAALVGLQYCEEYVEEMRGEYDRRRKLIVNGLNQIGLPTFEPGGAFYCFPEIKGCGLDDDTFCSRLLMEEKVAIIPGSGFGAGGEGYARISYATAYEKLEIALERIAAFVKKLR